MSVSGLCQICERQRADYQCSRCGALVCEAHYDPETGYCTDCAAEVRAGRGDSGPR
ncbi:zinc finger HIT domain-containing protein [Halobacterium yunchengense]|uniref:zinc finger HIT domain-containing protein n=1 Tax=Halobacterium yunchengense TaxID=3108497 RepID=UPI0030089F22